MIPFDKIYSWLFKSFNISGETILVERLINEGYQELMIIKRSWIFALFMLWLPICILILSGVSIFIAYASIDIINVKYTLIVGNVVMALILIVSSINYIRYFRSIHHEPRIMQDTQLIRDELALGDKYFVSFFNWSLTNQWILILIIFIEIALVLLYGQRVGDHFWILATDTLVILVEIGFMRKYRKRMMDLEMDYNIVVKGKIFFINQSGLLSTIQTIDGDKIKTVQSIFPSKIASFFNYGTIHILTEGDTALMGTMSMYYITDPDSVVSNIELLLKSNRDDRDGFERQKTEQILPETADIPETNPNEIRRHTVDTREKIRDVLR